MYVNHKKLENTERHKRDISHDWVDIGNTDF